MDISKRVELKEISETELDTDLTEARNAARSAASKAYAPFSNFFVGAALVLENGLIIQGNNQENAAFPSGLCAERVALFYAGAQYPGIAVNALVVYAYSEKFQVPEVLCPCGACLQVMAETRRRQKDPFKILLDSGNRMYLAQGIETLLPFAFELRE